MTEAQQWFEQLKQSIRDEARKEALPEGLKEGLRAGQLQALATQFEKKLDRPLAETERSVLAERSDRLGLDRLDDVRLALSTDALAAWLADPAAC
ncbi:hypothetical protein WME98_25875 [Sorangium sp. So ce296]|uniref:hypothetical protein n=1 Tax=Sorangium sp. So ce296 TaxID=3133296 RepID=UPI003F63BAFC